MEKLPSVINVVYDERAENYIYFDGGAAIQKNPDILVVSEDMIDKQLGSYILPYNVKDGDVLIRNIYATDPAYVRATEAARELWKGKCTRITELMSKLGAVKCEFESCHVQTHRREKSADVNAKYKLVKVDASYNKTIENTATEDLKLTSTNSEDKPFELTHEEWENVRNEAIESKLFQESDIRSIINRCEPGIKQRKQKMFSLTCNVATESNTVLDIAFGLSYCDAFSLNAELQDKISLHNEITVKYSVQF